MGQPDGLPSVEIFARNVTDREGLGLCLIDVARAELGAAASEIVIEQRASELLLYALCSVGVDPRTERQQRDRLSRLMSGDPLPGNEVQRAVEYVLSQMVIQPKGALAECLAIPLCVKHLQYLKATEDVPASAVFSRGVWSRRLRRNDTEEDLVFKEWREGADGIFSATATPEMDIVLDDNASSQRRPEEGDLLVFGVSEVKCYRPVPRRRLLQQLNKHLARLAGGLQLRDWRGKTVECEYPPDRLWYAVGDTGRLRVLPATDAPFRLVTRAGRRGRRSIIVWTAAMMDSLVAFAVGPQPSGTKKTAVRGGRPAFDALIAYDQDELEDMGVAMAHYTLGAMADQPDIDLSGAEWSWNVERALEVVGDDPLSPQQLARRQKLLGHFE
jgi:hypothetical protein